LPPKAPAAAAADGDGQAAAAAASGSATAGGQQGIGEGAIVGTAGRIQFEQTIANGVPLNVAPYHPNFRHLPLPVCGIPVETAYTAPVAVATTPASRPSPPPEPEQDVCSICQDELRSLQVLRQINGCGHAFHAECLDGWLKTHSTCPMCRLSLHNSHTSHASRAQRTSERAHR